MNYRLICLLILTLGSVPLRAQTVEEPAIPPFRLDVSVTYLNTEKFPEVANYIYKKTREIPGVFIVPEAKAQVRLILSDVGDGKVYACTCTVLESEDYQINSALIPVQLAPVTGNKATDAWKQDLKTNFNRLESVYRLKETWTAMRPDTHQAIDRVLANFAAHYVEDMRRICDAPLVNLDDPKNWPEGVVPHATDRVLTVPDWMAKH